MTTSSDIETVTSIEKEAARVARIFAMRCGLSLLLVVIFVSIAIYSTKAVIEENDAIDAFADLGRQKIALSLQVALRAQELANTNTDPAQFKNSIEALSRAYQSTPRGDKPVISQLWLREASAEYKRHAKAHNAADQAVEQYLSAAMEVARKAESGGLRSNDAALIYVLEVVDGPLAAALETSVAGHLEEGEIATETYHRLEAAIWIATVLLMLAQALLVFAPVCRRLISFGQTIAETRGELQQTKGRLALAVEASGVGLWDWNIKKGKVWVSKEWSNHLGWPQQLNGFDIDDCTEQIHPDDLSYLTTEIQNHLKHNIPFDAQFRTRTPQGEFVWLKAIGKALRLDGGKPVRLMGASLDISETKRREKKHQRIARNLARAQKTAQLGSWELYLQDARMHWSDQMHEIMGIDPDGFTPSCEDLTRYVHADDRERVKETIMRSLRERTPYNIEYRVLPKREGGEDIVVNAKGEVELDAKGQPFIFLGTIQDITDLKRTQEKLGQSVEELEQFTRLASHDLQEPLRKIIMFSDLLEREFDGAAPGTALGLLNTIKGSAQRMRSLVKSLLQMARMRSGQPSLAVVNPGDCIEIAIAALYSQIKDTGAEITFDELPLVLADTTLLTQIFQNLISNSLKFTPENEKPRIIITAEQCNGDVVIGIIDNGIGVPAEFQEKIFQPFERLHGQSEYEGNGIGLAFCKRAIEKHGGRIWVESNTKTGAQFRFAMQSANTESTAA